MGFRGRVETSSRRAGEQTPLSKKAYIFVCMRGYSELYQAGWYRRSNDIKALVPAQIVVAGAGVFLLTKGEVTDETGKL